MPLFATYSRRKRRAEQGGPEITQYDQAPNPLRIQVRHILDSALGRWEFSSSPSYFGKPPAENNSDIQRLHNRLIREKAARFLFNEQADPKRDILDAVSCGLDNVEDWLDVVELCFVYISCLRQLTQGKREDRGITQDPESALDELNVRFREAGFGYQFEEGRIIRIDSQLLHSDVVKPALVLLADSRFAGPQEEFLSAHAHYRAGEHQDAILDANRAFESTMKAICKIKRWEYQQGDRASELIKLIRKKNLLPKYLDRSFDQLIATLQSGLPQVRNTEAAHGQGAAPRKTPGYIAGYALHLAAANIVLLVEALKETKRR
jgi:AbiJ N-terminal domain 4